ncbi:tRNA wybutosine-synthesizing protein 3 homolog isoform X2 [Tachyglossus aculeatus]|uniref:tRNA wybutosine-synthesizing protein 3 homolog isoform X2 n=1 Tax=Tachyglossus aculeatus TaxID=9261 RepID=UPI0018F56779|nr:tRNA wybutosine-synthesizing protein 3 homolog isoform X2 [Tachyglossus aculeatus]
MSSGGHRVAAMASCSGAGPQGFGHRKAQALGRADGSRKGSVDAAAAELVRSLNRQHRFCTTSSCAGRMLLVDRILALQKASGNAVLKFEPFVLHVLCRELQDAQLLHSVAIASGFRNSGITVGKKGKIMMAVRSTHVLEVPLCRKGKLMVSQEYIDFLIQIANEKMEENKRRIERFYNCLQLALKTEETPNDATAEKTPVVYTRRRKKNPERVQDSRVSAEKADTRLESDGDSETNLDFFLEKY